MIVQHVVDNLLPALKLDEPDECIKCAPCGAHVDKRLIVYLQLLETL